MFTFEVKVPVADVMRAADDIREAERAGLLRVETAIQSVAVRKVAAMRLRRVPTRQEQADYRFRSGQNKSGRRRRLRNPDAPLWRPTGELLRSVQSEPIWDGPTAVELHADVPYAEHRHWLGEDGMPEHPALGIIRQDPFFLEAEKIVEPAVEDLFSDGFNSVWEND